MRCMTSSCTMRVRFGMRPRKIYELAKLAFADDFDDATILKWLDIYRRFFTPQPRSSATCIPDGGRSAPLR